MLTAWVRRRYAGTDGRDITITPEDVAAINGAQKLARLAMGHHEDSWVDVIGYAECVAQLRDAQRNGARQSTSCPNGSHPNGSYRKSTVR